jgi:site-specific recombinase XerD
MSFWGSAEYTKVYRQFMTFNTGRKSKQGIETLQKNVRFVMNWCFENAIELNGLTVGDALAFRLAESGRIKKDGHVISEGTVCNRLKAARSLFAFLLSRGVVKTNPFAEVSNPRIPEHISRNTLSEAQMAVLLAKLERFDEAGNRKTRLHLYRVHVLAEFLHASGMRVSEAASLTESNFDLDQKLVYIPHGKGGASRTAFLTGRAASVLKLYFKRGRAIILEVFQVPENGNAFICGPGRLQSLVNTELVRQCRSLGLPPITSHGFRHSLGTRLLRGECDIRHIQGILGHASIASTQVYTQVDRDDVKNSMDKFHPRGNLQGISA